MEPYTGGSGNLAKALDEAAGSAEEFPHGRGTHSGAYPQPFDK